MNFFRVILLCLFALAIAGCRKKSETVAKEVGEAGYAMTAEGWSEAIRSDNVEVMKKMVKGGFDIKTTDSNGLTGLHIAAEAGSTEAAGYLLNLGYSVDVKSADDKTPLMLAALADRPEMVKWLLRQGADPKLKDRDGFMALMLAVTNDRPSVVEELATYHREDLDSAVLLASLVGHAKVIDTLTNYGASVYARMEDGRTPLMLAAQNGHREAVKILMDIGASRFATTESGDTAQSFAVSAGHHEIADLIEKGFSGESIALESEQDIAVAMDEYFEEFLPGTEEVSEDDLLAQNDTEIRRFETGGSPPTGGTSPDAESPGQQPEQSNQALTKSVKTLEGANVSRRPSLPAQENGADPIASAEVESADLPLIMRHYRQRELPVEVKKVSGSVASLRLAGMKPAEIEVKAGETIPGSKLLVVKVHNRIETGKLNDNQPIEVGVIEVEDSDTGQRREWIAGRPAASHDPVALVEDAITGQRYIAQPGQKFSSEDGREFMVNDVRPSQIVIEDTATGEVRTLPLRGPKG